MAGARRARQPEIIVTVTRVAPGTDRERDAVRAARRVWLDAQMDALGQEITDHGPKPKRRGEHTPVMHPAD